MSISFKLENFKNKDTDFVYEWNDYIDDLTSAFNINFNHINMGDKRIEVWCNDDDLENLFNTYQIEIGKVIHTSKEFKYDEDTYEPIGLSYGDFIETVELKQNGKTFLCDAYCAYNGCGAEYAFALFEIM